jgi:hypothetical protein
MLKMIECAREKEADKKGSTVADEKLVRYNMA